jgi:hypothetical protein
MKPTKTPFKYALKEALLKELGLKPPKNDKMIAQDPFLMLGYGINAFFDLLSSLSTMFLWITIFFIPVFHIYASHGAYYDQKSW